MHNARKLLADFRLATAAERDSSIFFQYWCRSRSGLNIAVHPSEACSAQVATCLLVCLVLIQYVLKHAAGRPALSGPVLSCPPQVVSVTGGSRPTPVSLSTTSHPSPQL